MLTALPMDRQLNSATSIADGIDGWPPRRPVLGVPISCTTYGEAVACILAAARERTCILA